MSDALNGYHGIFAEPHWNGASAGWPVVMEEFRMIEPQPDEVIYAGYTYEDYSGDAVVLYRNGEELFLVEGGHCSCYGLEDQWHPEEPYTREDLRAYLARIDPYCAQMIAAKAAGLAYLNGEPSEPQR